MKQIISIAAAMAVMSFTAGIALAATMPNDIQGIKSVAGASVQHVDWHRHHHCWWKHGHKHCN